MKRFFSTLSYMVIGGGFAFLIANSSSWILNNFLIAVITILFGLGGFLQAKKSAPSNQDSNQPKKIQFSLLRLLLATSMVALVFGVMKICFNFKESAEIFATSMIAIGLGGLVLICRKSDFKPRKSESKLLNILIILFIILVYFLLI
jgi:hypothetical protein